MNQALSDLPPSKLCALIKVVQLAIELQSSDECADKSLDECVLEAVELIDRARQAIEIVSEHGVKEEHQNN